MVALKLWLHLLNEIVIDKLVKDVVDVFIVVIGVTLVDDHLVHLHVLLVRGHSLGLATEELQQFLNVVLVDKLLALLQRYFVFH